MHNGKKHVFIAKNPAISNVNVINGLRLTLEKFMLKNIPTKMLKNSMKNWIIRSNFENAPKMLKNRKITAKSVLWKKNSKSKNLDTAWLIIKTDKLECQHCIKCSHEKLDKNEKVLMAMEIRNTFNTKI